jgi:peptidoglycan/LPS O-acetylase OafA/YrhL
VGTLRLFLALAISTAHLVDRVFPELGHPAEGMFLNLNGGRPVALFFVVSGFLISYVLDRKYHAGDDLAAFYRARFLRIYPLWWALCAVAFLTNLAIVAARPVSDSLWTLGLVGADWVIALRSYPEPYPIMYLGPLGIGWSLAAEVAFYLLAPFILRSWRLVALLFVLTTILRFCIVRMFASGPEWHCLAYYFFPTLLPFFLLGHVARVAGDRLELGPVACVTLLAIALACLKFRSGDNFDNPWFYVALLFFAAALPSLFHLTKNHRLSNAVGELTYPLYLTHTLVMLTILLALPRLRQDMDLTGLSPLAQFGVMALIANLVFVAVAAATLVCVERPLSALAARALNWLQPLGRRAPQS